MKVTVTAAAALLTAACATGPTMPGEGSSAPVALDVVRAHHAGRHLSRPTPSATASHAPAHTPSPRPTPQGTVSGRGRATPAFTAWATSAGTHRVFECESHWNPTDVSATGKYRGLIQADATFWRSWHGLQFAPSADKATVTEQLQVAYWAWRKRGWSPWPTCGRLA